MPSDHSPNASPIILRIGEIFLKGKNRNVFFRRLVKNARYVLKGLDDVVVEALHLRIIVWHPPELKNQVLKRLGRLFGLTSVSPAITVSPDLESISATAVELSKRLPAGETFKVESKRRDKSFPLTSQDLSREVGGAIHTETGRPVDVRRPAHVIHVEVDRKHSFVFGEVVPGPGGLPVGTAGNVSLLLSGGIDSPVAGWMAMRRGCNINGIYYHSFPFTGDKTKEKVIDLARILSRWQGRTVLNVVHFTDVQKTLRDRCRPELAVLLYRRMMMRAASLIAAGERSQALLTGENLGQVASQTLANLGVIEDAASLPILRPLLTYDKAEIIAKAETIGTYETSILPYDDTCSLFVPKHPATKARIQDLHRAEEALDVDAMAAELADSRERIVVNP
jgi:thiamine biosynthesis protein ThiI